MTGPVLLSLTLAGLVAAGPVDAPAPDGLPAPAPPPATTTATAMATATAPAGEQPVAPYVQSAANAGATPVAGVATFHAFHGLEGVKRIASTLVDRSEADPRIRDIFAAADTARLKRTLGEQLCYLLNGGCVYTGRDMRQAHAGQGLQSADFNALVENLQVAMDKEGVPFRAQNVLLAKLAPMERVAVERTSPVIFKSWARRLASLHPSSPASGRQP